MTPAIERLAELRRHVDHLRAISSRVTDAGALRADLSLHNDVLFSLLMIAQNVVDVASELSARRGLRVDDYTTAVENLSAYSEFPAPLVAALARLPGFRNILVHEYARLDLDRVVAALHSLDPVDDFARIAAGIVADQR
ncbi:MAG TPA: HepT-like ribonuclease domain-containing protein [Longimicrobiales bacterium]|nr:HepT-like ribonuclease domain-containing protein [Longimicrobiales bacterium]